MNRKKYLEGHCTQCGGSIAYPAETIGTITTCPHCRKPTELLLAAPPQEPVVPRRAVVWTVVGVVILLLGLAASVAGLKWLERQQQRLGAKLPAGLAVSPLALQQAVGEPTLCIAGAISNRLERQRFGIRVEFDLLDAAGRKLETKAYYQPVLEPNSGSHFKVPIDDPKAAAVKLVSIKEGQPAPL
jgi:hypothetical protein